MLLRLWALFSEKNGRTRSLNSVSQHAGVCLNLLGMPQHALLSRDKCPMNRTLSQTIQPKLQKQSGFTANFLQVDTLLASVTARRRSSKKNEMKVPPSGLFDFSHSGAEAEQYELVVTHLQNQPWHLCAMQLPVDHRCWRQQLFNHT